MFRNGLFHFPFGESIIGPLYCQRDRRRDNLKKHLYFHSLSHTLKHLPEEKKNALMFFFWCVDVFCVASCFRRTLDWCENSRKLSSDLQGYIFCPPPIKTWKYKGHTNIETQCKGELFRRKTSQANQLKLILRVR